MARRNAARLLVGTVRRGRAGLLHGTALQAVTAIVFVTQAGAQPAPTARPIDGNVVAGSASISQTSAQTTINQSTQRAAINWQSFDVGGQHAVQFNQPDASAWTLNRVTGPDPSQIAGRISANGSIVITNAAGVVFHQGAQVNATNLIVSAPGITNQNFMAGQMVFDQAPNPGAMVRNAGTITVKDTGLAALVAPGVANSGTINARMGRAILAGAEAHTIDLYGDGLVAIDVTKSVTQVPRGPDGKAVAALVTNTGTIVADGGTVHITATAADGLITNLVQAGGKVQANTVGNQPGRVLVSGVGGSVRIEGQVLAEGGSGQPGGQVAVNTSHGVTVANGARISANGYAGGGTVALGTTVERAAAGRTAALTKAKSPGTPQGTARRVTVEQGATVSADGLGGGAGGTVAVLSTEQSQVDGNLSARGGPSGGDGGVVETSSDGGLSVTQAPDLGAPAGSGGTWFLDPYDLIIGTGSPQATFNNGTTNANDPPTSQDPPNNPSYIAPSTIENASKSGTVTISIATQHDLTVQESLNLAQGFDSGGGGVSGTGGASLSLQAGHDLSVLANISMGTFDPNGARPALTLDAGHQIFIGPETGSPVTLSGFGTITMTTTGPIGSDPTGSSITIHDGSVVSTGGSIVLQASNRIDIGANVQMSAGSNTSFLYAAFDQTYTGIQAVAGNDITVALSAVLSAVGAGGEAPPAAVFLNAGRNVSLSSGAGVTVSGGSNPQVYIIAGDSFPSQLMPNAPGVSTTGSVSIGGASVGAERTSVTAGSFDIESGTAGSTFIQSGSSISGASGFISGGSGGVQVNGIVDVGTSGALTLNGNGAVTEDATGAVITGTLSGTADSYALTSRSNQIAQVGDFSNQLAATAGDIVLVDSVPLTIGGTPQAGGRGVSVPTGHTVSIATDAITIGADFISDGETIVFNGPGVSAPGGVFAVQPYTTGKAVDLLSSGGNANDLLIFRSDLSNVLASRLQIGSSTAGNVVVAADGVAMDLTSVGGGSGFTQLDLISSGTITQRAGVTVPTITASGTSVNLSNTANGISSVGTSTASTGSFFLTTASGQLTVNGTITAATTGTEISLQADKIEAGAGAGLVSNTIILQPLTAGRGAELVQTAAEEDPAKLSMTQALINAIQKPNGSQRDTVLQLRGSSIAVGASGDTIDMTGHVDVFEPVTTGAITEGAGAALKVGFLLTPGTGPSSISLPGPNSIAAIHAESAGAITIGNTYQGTFIVDVLHSGTSVTVDSTGPVLIQSFNTANDGSRDPINAPVVSLTGSSIALDSTVANSALRATQSLSLNSTGVITQGALPIITPLLTGMAGSATLTNASNAVTNLGSFSTTAGNFSLTDGVTLHVTGGVSVPTGQTLSLASDSILFGTGANLSAPSGRVILGPATSGAAFTLDSSIATASVTASTLQIGTGSTGPITISGTLNFTNVNTLDLRSGAAITEGAGASLQVARLTGQAGSATLDGPNQIGTLAGFATTGAFTLRDTQSLTVTGLVQGSSISLAVAGDLGLSGEVRAPSLSITASGAVTQSAGLIETAALRLNAASASLLSARNAITGLGGFNVTGQFNLADGTGLRVSGPGSAGSIALTSAGSIELAGDVTSSQLAVNAGGTVTQTGGTLNVGTLTGTAVGLAQFGTAGTANVSTLGSMVLTGSTLTLVDSVPLTVTGPLVASNINLSAPGSLTLQGGQITTNAASLTAPNLVQTGTTQVAPETGGIATLQLTAANGALSLGNLLAPSVNVGLTLGNGNASGTLSAAGLNVNGSGGSASLFGSVAGQTGFAAAPVSTITPRIDLAYTINGCVIATTCGIVVELPPVVVPPLAVPFDVAIITPKGFLETELGNTFRTDLFTADLITVGVIRDPNDPDLLLPNISDRDY